MKKYLEYNDGKSSKFWQIEVSLSSHTVSYGKIGTKGREQIKKFNSEEEAITDAEKLIESKTQKGYIEKINSTKPDKKKATANYNKLLNTKTLHKDLCKHFAYLADTPGFEPILSAIMQKAHKVQVEENKLVVSFPGNDKLFASPPADMSKYQSWPKSFQKCVAVHEYLAFPEEGWSMYLGDAGNFEAEYLEEDESDLLDHVEAENALCPITEYSDWWLYHPGKKNYSGEDSLCFFSHEGGDIEKPIEYNVGSLFLKMMAESLELELDFPENIGKKVDSSNIKVWWQNLSEDWKKAFSECLDIKNEPELKDKELKKIINAKRFYSHDSELNLDSLEPLRILSKLEEINLTRQKEITDLSPLKNLIELEAINIKDAQVTDIACLSNLRQLRRLKLENMPIKDISPLSNLTKLERLEIQGTLVKDLSPIAKLPKLENINISNTKVDTLEHLTSLKKLSDIELNKTAITSLDPLGKFKKLGRVSLDATEITDLSPLYDVKGIYILHIQKSKVSFRELMQFVFHHMKAYTSGHLGIDIYSEYLMDNDVFLEELKNIDFELGELGEVLSIWVNDKVITAVKQNKHQYAEDMLEVFLNISPIKQSEFIKEQLLGNTLALMVHSKNKALLNRALDLFMPKKITTSIVAFNLACLYTKDKKKLLEFTKLALKLGHEPNKFKEDSDFKNCLDDTDFIELLSTPQTPGPDEDIKAWWNGLDEDWQDCIDWQLGYPESLAELSEKIKSQESMTCREMKSLGPLRYFTALKSLKTEYSAFTSIEDLQHLKNLESLEIEGDDYMSKAKIKSIESISDLLNLKFLRITHQDVSDLSPIKKLTNLENLTLFLLPIKNINALKNLTKLKKLYLGGKFDIENIDALENCTQLEDLNFSGKQITNIEALRKHTKLTNLNFYQTQISDLTPISGCIELKELSINDSPITSLQQLENMKELTVLSLYGTKILKAEIKAFIAKNPKCKVDYSAD